MALSRIVAISLALIGWTIVVVPAHACDSNYPWLCPPVPSIDPPADAAEPAKVAKPAKPQPTARHAAKPTGARVGKASARKIAARKAAMHRFAARAHMKAVMASRQAEPADARTDIGETRANVVHSPFPARGPVVAPPREANGSGGASNGFASMWADRSVAAIQAPPPEGEADTAPAAAAPPADAAAAAPAAAAPAAAAPAAAAPAVAASAPVAPRSQANELDLAAAEPPPPASADQSWLRSLFLAFGGLLAAGTALRFII